MTHDGVPTGPDPAPALDDATIAFASRVFDYARDGRTEDLAGLLVMGLPPNLRNGMGDTLMMLAGYHGNADTVRCLPQAGADPRIANDRGQIPLAGAQGDLEVVQALLGRADADGRGGSGRTALMPAAMFNRIEIMGLLLWDCCFSTVRIRPGTTQAA